MRPAAIPLGKQAYRRDLGFMPEVELLNMLLEKDENGVSPDGVIRVTRPGLLASTILSATIQGIFREDGVLNGASFAVAGGYLYSYTPGASTQIGYVGIGRVVFAATYLALYIMAGGMLYSWDGTTLLLLTMPDNRLIVDMDTLDSYVILGCPDGRFYWLVPGDTTIDPLNFSTAESSPDGLVAVRRLVDEIWLFGSKTIEPWQPTGDATAPFQKAQGRVYDRGCGSRDTVIRFDNALFWEGDDGFIYRSAAVPQRVSTDGIEERIQGATAPRSAWQLSVPGHKCYVLNIPGVGTWAYDASSQEWSQFASPSGTGWRAVFGYDNVAASGDSGEIWTVVPTVGTDADQPFRKAVTGTVGLQGRPQRNANASFSVGCSAETTFSIRWRDADEQLPDYWEDFDVFGPAEIFTLYRMGQGRQPYRTFELQHLGSEQISVFGAAVNAGWQ